MQTQHFKFNKPHPQETKEHSFAQSFHLKSSHLLKLSLGQTPETTENSRDIHSELERVLQPVQ